MREEESRTGSGRRAERLVRGKGNDFERKNFLGLPDVESEVIPVELITGLFTQQSSGRGKEKQRDGLLPVGREKRKWSCPSLEGPNRAGQQGFCWSTRRDGEMIIGGFGGERKGV